MEWLLDQMDLLAQAVEATGMTQAQYNAQKKLLIKANARRLKDAARMRSDGNGFLTNQRAAGQRIQWSQVMHKLDAKIKSFGMAKEFLRNEYGMPFKNDKAAPNSTGKDGVVTNRIIHVDQEGNEWRIRIVKDKNAFHYQREEAENGSETEVDDDETPDYDAENAEDEGEGAAADAQLPQQQQEPKGTKKRKNSKASEDASASTGTVATGDAVAAANDEAGRGKRQKQAPAKKQ